MTIGDGKKDEDYEHNNLVIKPIHTLEQKKIATSYIKASLRYIGEIMSA